MQKYSIEARQLGVLWLAALMWLLTVGGSYWLLRSRHGLALTAMRDNAVSAMSQGVDVARLRFLVFLGRSALFRGRSTVLKLRGRIHDRARPADAGGSAVCARRTLGHHGRSVGLALVPDPLVASPSPVGRS